MYAATVRMRTTLYVQCWGNAGGKVKSARGAETRLRIIQTAAELFNKHGVGATSPDQIIEASAPATRFRRLAHDYERLAEMPDGLRYVVFVIMMLKKAAEVRA